jgi:hypothetical protein
LRASGDDNNAATTVLPLARRRGLIHTRAMHSPSCLRLVRPLAAIGLVATTSCVRAQVGTIVPDTPSPAAVEACERSARQAVPTSAREPAEVTFNGAPIVQPGPGIDGQQVLRGAGHWRGAGGTRSFSYTCNVDSRSGEAVGLVLRDTTAPVAAKSPPPRPPAEPDLSQLSPAACESSAVAALKARWPYVSQISFDARTREFRQPSASSALLHGSGRAMPDLSSPSRLFGFDCEIDPRSGRVLHIGISG